MGVQSSARQFCHPSTWHLEAFTPPLGTPLSLLVSAEHPNPILRWRVGGDFCATQNKGIYFPLLHIVLQSPLWNYLDLR